MVFISLLKASYNKALQYRMAHVMGIVTQIFWGLMSVFIASTFYASETSDTTVWVLSATVTYLWLGRVFTQMLSPYPTIGISQMILNGQIACEILRPISTYFFLFLKILAERISSATFSFPFIIMISTIMPGKYRLSLPTSWEYFLLFLVSITVSLFLITAFEMSMEVGSFYSTSFHGISTAMSQLFYILSGSTIPLVFFPEWAQKILHVLPFASILDTPFSIYLGQESFNSIVIMLLKQVLWTVMIILLGCVLMHSAMKKIEINGG